MGWVRMFCGCSFLKVAFIVVFCYGSFVVVSPAVHGATKRTVGLVTSDWDRTDVSRDETEGTVNLGDLNFLDISEEKTPHFIGTRIWFRLLVRVVWMVCLVFARVTWQFAPRNLSVSRNRFLGYDRDIVIFRMISKAFDQNIKAIHDLILDFSSIWIISFQDVWSYRDKNKFRMFKWIMRHWVKYQRRFLDTRFRLYTLT